MRAFNINTGDNGWSGYNGRRKLLQTLIPAGCAVLVLVLSLAAGCIISRAQISEKAVSYKYYTSVVVRPGDTLWSIAQSYSDANFESEASYIQEVIDTNHLSDEELHVGDYLIVPYYSTEFK